MGDIVERIRYEIEAKATKLDGFNVANAELRKLKAGLSAIHTELNGLTTNATFKKGLEQITGTIKGLSKAATAKDLAKALGFDAKDFEANFLNLQEKATRALERAQKERAKLRGKENADARAKLAAQEKDLQAALNRIQGIFTGKKLTLGPVQRVAEFVQGYQRDVLRSAKAPLETIQGLFEGRPAAAAASAAAPAPAAAAAPAPTPAASSQAAGGGGGGKKSGPKGMDMSGPGGSLVGRKVVETSEGVQSVTERDLLAAGKTLDRIMADVDGVLKVVKTVETTVIPKGRKEDLARRANALGAMVEQNKGSLRKDPGKLAEVYRKASAQIAALLGDGRLEELEKIGLGTTVDSLRKRSIAYANRANKLDAQAAAEKERADDAARRDQVGVADQRAARRVQREKASQADEEARARAARAEARASSAAGALRMAHGSARGLMAELESQGFVFASRSRAGVSPRGTVKSDTFTGRREQNGMIETRQIRLDFVNGKEAGAAVSELEKRMARTRDGTIRMGNTFLENTAKVGRWALSVALIYEPLRLARKGMEDVIQQSGRFQQLDRSFSGVGGSARKLESDLLRVAAAERRSTEEAMQSGTDWARQQLSRVQVLEAVRQSMRLANLTEQESEETTQGLITLYKVYGLRVGQLSTVVSEFSNVSKSLSVDSGALTRNVTASAEAAKMAGMSLTDLTATMASAMQATPGGGGQGLGVMFSRMLSGFSDPAEQKNLRQQFKIELTTEGGAETKSAVAILGELWAAYEKLGEAQRNSLTFQVAGRTQAKRLSAVLDNYVRGQVMAINAQLNLSAAEEENIRIKETLRGELRGLSAEWDQFIIKQGNRGPVQAMTGIAAAFRNTLALANTPGGSAVATGFLGLLAASGARLLVTAMAMKEIGQSGGFVARSLAQVAGAWRGLDGMLGRTTKTFIAAAGGRSGISSSLLGGQKASLPGLLFGGEGGAAWAMASRNMAAATLNATRNATLFGASMRGVGQGAAMAIKGLGTAMVAVRQFAAPLLIVYGAVKTFNVAMDHLGASSDRAERALAGFNAQAERSGEAARAMTAAANLAGTVARALPGMRSADRLAAVTDATGAAFPELQGAARGRAQSGLLAERKAALANGDVTAVQASLERQRASAIESAAEARQREYVANREQETALEAELARLRQKQLGLGSVFVSQQKILELEKTRYEIQNRQAGLLVQETADLEAFHQADERSLAATERRTVALRSIAEMFHSLPGASATDRNNADIAAGRAGLSYLDSEQSRLQGEQATGEARRWADERQAQELRRAATDIRERAKGFDSFFRPRRVGTDMLAQASDYEAEAAKLERGGETAAEKRVRSQLQQITEARKKEEERLAGLESNRPAAERQTVARIAMENARAAVAQFEFGEGPGERLANKEAGLRRLMAGKLREANANAPQTDAGLTARVALLQHAIDLEELRLEKNREIYNLTREENDLIIARNREFQRSLLTAGPEEMLRKMATFQLSRRGMTPGQFFALNPAARQDAMMLNPDLDPEMGRIRRDLRRLGPAASAGDLATGALTGSRDRAGLLGEIGMGMRLDEIAKANVEFMNAGNAAAALAADFGVLGDAVAGVIARLNSGTGGRGAQLPGLPQAGGFGGGNGRFLAPPNYPVVDD
jgi:hypothetical protein